MGIVHSGAEAPDFALTGLKGQFVSLHEGLAKGPILVAFFKISCPTCQYAFPFIERLQQHFHGSGAQIWGISQDNQKNSLSFVQEYGLTFPVLIDDHPYGVSSAYGLTHLPTLFLIDPSGQVVLSSTGFDKRDLTAVHSWLAEFTATTPPTLFQANERIPEYKPG